MLIDERMSANKRQLEFQRLTEELNRLHNQLDDVHDRHHNQGIVFYGSKKCVRNYLCRFLKIF